MTVASKAKVIYAALSCAVEEPHQSAHLSSFAGEVFLLVIDDRSGIFL